MAKNKSKAILILEDDEGHQFAINQILEPLNYHLIFASSGNEGLDVLKNTGFQFCLIISDIHLNGGMNGIQFIKEVNSNPLYNEIPIIVLSSDLRTAENLLFIRAKLDKEKMVKELPALVTKVLYEEKQRNIISLLQQHQTQISELRSHLNLCHLPMLQLKKIVEELIDDDLNPSRTLNTALNICKLLTGK